MGFKTKQFAHFLREIASISQNPLTFEDTEIKSVDFAHHIDPKVSSALDQSS